LLIVVGTTVGVLDVLLAVCTRHDALIGVYTE